MDEADPLVDRTLVERVGREETVDVAGAQVGDHLRRRDDANLDVPIRIETVLGHVVAQQEVVHRVLEGHAEGEAAPLRGVALVLMVVVQHDRLAVDVLDGRGNEVPRTGAGAQGHGQRHRRQHVGGVVVVVERVVADQRPAGGLDHVDVEAVALVEAHGVGHDDRRGAGDGDEAHVQAGLLQRAEVLLDGRLDGVHREQGGQGRGHGAAPHQLHELAAVHVAVAEDAAHQGALHHPVHHLLAVARRPGGSGGLVGAATGRGRRRGRGRSRGVRIRAGLAATVASMDQGLPVIEGVTQTAVVVVHGRLASLVQGKACHAPAWCRNAARWPFTLNTARPVPSCEIPEIPVEFSNAWK